MRIALLMCLIATAALGDSSFLEMAKQGQIVVPSGTLYVPADLEWELQEGSVIARRDEEIALFIASSEGQQEVLEGKALGLIRERMAPALSLELPTLEQLDAREAPYPFPGTQELKLKAKPFEHPMTVYVGSGSGHTLIVAAFGPNAEHSANRIAASFKENFENKRRSQAREGRSDRIQSMLGAGTIFLLLFAAIVPAGLTHFMNRRRKERKNPFQPALIGIAVGVVLCLIFNYIILGRFSWAEASDYGQAFGGTLARGLAVAVVVTFFSRRWNPVIDNESAQS